MDLTPQKLNGRFISMVPIAADHREPLRQAANEDPSIFSYIPGNLPEQFDEWFDWSLGLMDGRADRIYVVEDQRTGDIVGSSRYLNISENEPKVEIGFTWYQTSVHGSYVNPEAKLLLMQNAFENWQCVRVELKADARNARSRAAMAKMGAQFEGTLRRHWRMSPTYVRDTVYYSVLDDEWPEVKRGLQTRLANFEG